MKKKWLLILLVLTFLSAGTFVQKDTSNNSESSDEVHLLNQLDRIVKKAERFANLTGTAEVQEVFQDQEDQIWKVQFSNGTIVLYDEETGEFVDAK